MDDLFGKVVIINMDGEDQRMAEVVARLRDTGTLRYERLPGVDGRKLTSHQRESLCTPYCRRMCTPAMTGCFLSHRKAWQQCVEEGLPSLLVLEDDVIFTKDAVPGIRRGIGEVPPDWDVFLCHCFTCNSAETTLEDASIVQMLYPHRREQQYSDHLWRPTMVFGMHAYAVSQKGARKLLEMMPRASNHVDWELSRFIDKLDMFALRPGVAYQTGMDSSSIGSKAPVFTNKILSKVPLGTHPQDGRTLAWLCSEAWFRVPWTPIAVNKYFVALFVCASLGYHTLAIGFVAGDLVLALLLANFPKTTSVLKGYGDLLFAVMLGVVLNRAFGMMGGITHAASSL